MKFNSHLNEGILLKRSLKFLAEVVLPCQQKIMIRCPNLGPMTGCDILGTKIYYSSPVGYHCLPTWELVEVDGGHLVCINSELIKSLVIEAISLGNIAELSGSKLLHTAIRLDSNHELFQIDNLLLEQNGRKCYLGLEHVILGDERGEGFFPNYSGQGINTLNNLIAAKQEGLRAVLLFCVLHTGIEYLKPAEHICAQYAKLLNLAVAQGVEVIAYRSIISLQDIEIAHQVPVVLSADAVLK